MRRIRNYRMFPCAVPDCGAGHPRVTHPSAASATEVAFARLACLRRAASVRSEPGSNSPSWTPRARGPRLIPCISTSVLPAARQRIRLLPFRSELTEAPLPLFISSLPFADISVKDQHLPCYPACLNKVPQLPGICQQKNQKFFKKFYCLAP